MREPAGGDYSNIKIRYMEKGQEPTKKIDHVSEREVLEHEQYVPI